MCRRREDSCDTMISFNVEPNGLSYIRHLTLNLATALGFHCETAATPCIAMRSFNDFELLVTRMNWFSR